MAPNPLAPAWLALPSDANALAPGLWPATTRRTALGELEIGGVAVSALVAEFGTPLYVIDEADARSRAETLRHVFETEFARIGAEVHVYYAGKSFLSIEIVQWMLDAGLNIDVCTTGELAVALAAGAEPSRLGYHGNNKSLAEIDEAARVRIGSIVIDSEIEIARVAAAAARHGVTLNVRLRVNSGVHASTHEFLATSHEDQKFGVVLDDAARLVALIRAEPSLRFIGLHCHIGSQIFGADGFAESASRLLRVHAALLEGGPVPELNLGGGFGIAYTSVDTPTPIGELAVALADIVAAECAQLDIPVPVIAFEPGRVIIGPAGATLYEVGTTKPVDVSGNTRLYVSVDGGMSDNIRPALYGADYTVRLANRVSAADPVLVRLAGKHCESGDIVVNADYLPGDVTPGDLVAIPATGAYCWSLANNYNYLGRPPVVAVLGGNARTLVRGETIADLLARDAGPRMTRTSTLDSVSTSSTSELGAVMTGSGPTSPTSPTSDNDEGTIR
ncbi:diaminopimelate decarboxylase [Cryobacterium sp. CG_9.6]|uniref:diaminopimelate decarboxylase n=1 Tax=Cryobacterium sp. CG_9.6 TaxID=2760710 RepID=UPI002475017C|nr:diaminopimelate decarboxylase [Cryobacterium sp. CG_9.6]MDH6236442.1 diaminopimelate decarboxylase [Cryobacterium sp. CG_9.6]